MTKYSKIYKEQQLELYRGLLLEQQEQRLEAALKTILIEKTFKTWRARDQGFDCYQMLYAAIATGTEHILSARSRSSRSAIPPPSDLQLLTTGLSGALCHLCTEAKETFASISPEAREALLGTIQSHQYLLQHSRIVARTAEILACL